MPPIRAASALLTLLACTEQQPGADAGLPDGSPPADAAIDAAADLVPIDQAPVLDQAAVNDQAAMVDTPVDRAGGDQGIAVADTGCGADACPPTPDAYAGAGCPCPELAALATQCPAVMCVVTNGWRPSGLGEGFMRDAELRAPDGHVCARLLYQRQFSFKPDEAAIFDLAMPSTVIASYTGLDYRPGAAHVLRCADQRAFFGVNEAQCPALAHLRSCDPPDAGAP